MKRLLKLSNNILQSNFRELPYPYRLTYILTYKCQCKCVMCNIWQRQPGREMSLEEIGRFFAKSNRFSWVNLSGGEIFLRDDLLDIIRTISDCCRNLYLLDFPTNGLQTERIVGSIEKIISLYRIPKLLVTVSMDGPSPLHNEIRGNPYAWKNAVETFQQLRRLRSKKFDVFLGMTLQPANTGKFIETVMELKDYIEDINFNEFHINMLHYSAHYYGNQRQGAQIDKIGLIDQIQTIMRMRKVPFFHPVGFIERRYHALLKKYLFSEKTPVPCQALGASFFMDPQGDVYPCSTFGKCVGNIADFDYDIHKLWDGLARKKVREDIRKGDCPQCWTPCDAYQSILANLRFS